MTGMVKGGSTVSKALQAFAGKADGVILRRYRMAVWAVFTRILDTTPQYTGRAVANWNIGVGSPDLTFDDDVGDLDESVSPMGDPRKVGDRGWIDYAIARNKPRLALITSKTLVYITNTTIGDPFRGDKREGPRPYLLDLQSPDRWVNILRAENAGAERLAELMLHQTWRQNFHRNAKNTDEQFFKYAGKSL